MRRSPLARIRNALLIGLTLSLLLIAGGLAWFWWSFDQAQRQGRALSANEQLIIYSVIGAAAVIGALLTLIMTMRSVRQTRKPFEQLPSEFDPDQAIEVGNSGDPLIDNTLQKVEALRQNLLARQTNLTSQTSQLHTTQGRHEAVFKLARLLNSTLEIETLLNDFVRSLVKKFDLSFVGVGLIENSSIVVRHGVTRKADQIESTSTLWLALSAGIAAEAAAESQIIIKRQPPFDTELPSPSTVATQVAHPLMNSGHIIGVLLSQSSQKLDEETLNHLRDIAELLASSLSNAHLFANARERATNLTAINDLARAISTSLDLKRILDTALQQIRQLIPYDQATVTTYDVGSNMFQVLAANDADYGMLSAGQETEGNGPLRTAYEAGHPVYIAEVEHHTGQPLQLPFADEAQSLLIQPLTTADVRLGTLNLTSRRPNAFDEQQVSLLGGLSHFLTTALVNGRLYNQRAQALQQLEQTQDHLLFVEKLRALGELASGVTHDFNNLLAGILGNVQVLMGELQNPEQRETLRVIERAAKDGAETVKRIQRFARKDDGEIDAPVELHELAEDALDLTRVRWRNAAQEQGVNIELQREILNVPTIRGHAAELREVLTNLIINAVDAMPNGGMLRVATGQRGSEVFVSVADSGVGMSEEVKARIFDPFFTTKGERGNGLGLAVSAAIVSRHSGRIEVQSIEGRGTNFAIWLPILEVDFAQVEATDHDIPNVRGSILIVEDEELVRIALSRMLAAWGHDVVSADSGRDALAKFRPGMFDLVITDLGMPDMMGWDVLRLIREREHGIRTMMLSGWARQIDPAEAKLRGADVVVAKPFDQAVLRTTVAHLLAGTLDLTPRVIA